MRDESFIKAIRGAMAEWSDKVLIAPNKESADKAFDYGHSCGFYQGLSHALSMAEQIIDREARDSDDDDDE